jgi:methylated-DNA-[protein]-cysteine S-methyltransferase
MSHRGFVDASIGRLHVSIDDDGALYEIRLPNRVRRFSPERGSVRARATFRDLEHQLHEYFDGKRRSFDLALNLRGTDFEVRVWRRLLEIPYGATTSYGAIAAELGLENGARAVGRANGDNPIPIVVPCHRVIGADGRLVGYGGGLPLKQRLLRLEGALSDAQLSLL